jgi:hypothetical protein
VLAEDRNTVVTEQDTAWCTGAIARSGLGRVVFALCGGQLRELQPPETHSPDAAQVVYEGPALFAEARVPIDGYLRLNRTNDGARSASQKVAPLGRTGRGRERRTRGRLRRGAVVEPVPHSTG